MATRLDKWEAQHRRNVERYAKMIDDIYKEAVREAASLSIPLTGVFSPDKPFSFADYPITRQRVRKLLESLKNSVEVAIVDGVRSEWTLANNKNNELCRRVFGDNVGKLTKEQYKRYYSNNDKAREAFLKRKTAGLSLSDRVWNYTNQFKEEIEMGLDLGLRDGLSADEMSRTLRQYLKYPDKLFRRVRDEHGNLHLSKRAAAFHPGQGVYRSSYKNARRLTATETNIAYRTSDYVRHKQLDFVVGIEVHLSGNHTLNGKPFEDICDDLKGRYPKDFKFTGWHPLCRCYTTTILKTPEEMAEDDRRIMAGEEPMPSEESGNYVPDVPEGFGKWIDKNTERIERAKSLPYFMRDNEKYIKPLTITPQARAGADEAQKFNEKMMRAADVPQAKKPRTRDEILAAAQERHAARTQEEIDEIKQRWETKKAFDKIEDELKAAGIEYNAPGVRKDTTEAAIIQSLAGGDMTDGSCSSLAFAYAGNRSGIDVLDFRGGVSRKWFANPDNVKKICDAVGGKLELTQDTIKTTLGLVRGIDIGKECYLAVGGHAAIVRRTSSGLEYLELQSSNMANNKFKTLDNFVLGRRFGATGYSKKYLRRVVLIDTDLLNSNYKFKRILGYINTESGKQMKGARGSEK